MTNILILDPDPARCAGLRSLVRDEGHDVVATGSVPFALDQVVADKPDLVLLAEGLGAAGNGYEVAGRLSQAMAGHHCPILMTSDLPATAERIDRALQAGCDRYLGRTEMGALGSILQRALASRAAVEGIEYRRQALDAENRRLRAGIGPQDAGSTAEPESIEFRDAPHPPAPLPGNANDHPVTAAERSRRTNGPASWIGQSMVSRELRKEVLRVAERGVSSVLVQGPMGAGRRLIAQILHETVSRTGEFEVLECTDLSATEFDRALFGPAHDGGSGLCDRARNGTIHLASIEFLSLAAQRRLLEILNNPVVPGTSRALDVFWVASTSSDLEECVERWEFDAPLLARLRSDELVCPPLSEHTDDLTELVRHFLERYGVAKGIRTVSPAALAAMESYPWPGNVAELADCIEQACVRADRGSLEVKDLSRSVRRMAVRAERVPMFAGADSQSAPEARMQALDGNGMDAIVPPAARWESHPWDITDQDPIDLEHYEKKALIRALASCGGDKLATAKLLKVGKSTLYRKLKRFGISAERGSVHR